MTLGHARFWLTEKAFLLFPHSLLFFFTCMIRLVNDEIFLSPFPSVLPFFSLHQNQKFFPSFRSPARISSLLRLTVYLSFLPFFGNFQFPSTKKSLVSRLHAGLTLFFPFGFFPLFSTLYLLFSFFALHTFFLINLTT